MFQSSSKFIKRIWKFWYIKYYRSKRVRTALYNPNFEFSFNLQVGCWSKLPSKPIYRLQFKSILNCLKLFNFFIILVRVFLVQRNFFSKSNKKSPWEGKLFANLKKRAQTRVDNKPSSPIHLRTSPDDTSLLAVLGTHYFDYLVASECTEPVIGSLVQELQQTIFSKKTNRNWSEKANLKIDI